MAPSPFNLKILSDPFPRNQFVNFSKKFGKTRKNLKEQEDENSGKKVGKIRNISWKKTWKKDKNSQVTSKKLKNSSNFVLKTRKRWKIFKKDKKKFQLQTSITK
jgi:hypothetical protein